MRVGIVTDSTAYLPADWATQHGVVVVPLSVLIDMDSYVEGEDRAAGELGRALARAGGATTSRPSPQQFLTRFEALAAEGAQAPRSQRRPRTEQAAGQRTQRLDRAFDDLQTALPAGMTINRSLFRQADFIAAPADRYDPEWIPLIKQAADGISHALGHSPNK